MNDTEGTIARKICLNLGASKPIGNKFVDAVVKESFDVFTFETALSYVSLPPRNSPATSVTQGKETDTLETYQRVFQFLKDRHVKKIFRVIVNDLTDRPHTDEMIISLLKEFDVEHWEWKKLDMNSEAIYEAAPRVKTVSLHSSGNYSALQGWACETGLIILNNVCSASIEAM